MYLGQKCTTFYAIDILSGKLVAQYQQGNADETRAAPTQDIHAIFSGNSRAVILLARSGYTVTCFVPSGKHWKISYSHFGGFTDPFVPTSPKDQSLRASPQSELLVYFSINRFLNIRDSQTLESMWIRKLPSIPINVFELLEPLTGDKLGPILSQVPISKRLKFGQDEKVDEIRITLGQENGHLFVLPSDAFPFFQPKFADHKNVLGLPEATVGAPIQHRDASYDAVSIEEGPESSCQPGDAEYPACLGGQYIAEVLRPTPLLGHGNKPVSYVASSFTYSWKTMLTFLALLVAYTYLAKHVFRRGDNRQPFQSSRSETSFHPPGFEEISIGSAAAIYRTLDSESASSLPKSFLISDEVIGYGSHGTVVFKGTFGDRPVAVKRMLSQFFDMAGHEVSLLRQSDYHQNVIRYYCLEKTDKFTYIVLELCRASLADLFESPQTITDPALKALQSSPMVLLQQITLGLEHLHEIKLIHRDLKPQNILITQTDRVVISDFGLSKKLADDQSSFMPTFQAGTSGWQAPECIVSSEVNKLMQMDEMVSVNALSTMKLSRSIDIFSLGCVFFYVLSQGQHPFGPRMKREANIVNNAADLSAISHLPVAQDLIRRMIDPSPSMRPTCKRILAHPFFWSAQRQLFFLQALSDKFESEDRMPFSEILQQFELRRSVIFQGQSTWSRQLDTAVWEDLGTFRKYNGRSARDLLRAIRNKRNHFHELSPEIRRILGETPEAFVHYFEARFPRLLLESYLLVEATGVRHENPFCSQFFPLE